MCILQGAIPSSALKKHFPHYGVFYPLQSFSKSRKVNFNQIPICIYAPDKKDERRLQKLGKVISKKVAIINDKERAVLHVGAVFVNNFSNLLYHTAETILEEENINFDLLLPLIKETAAKVQKHSPITMQTGPRHPRRSKNHAKAY